MLLEGLPATEIDCRAIAADLESLVDGLAPGVTASWVRKHATLLRMGLLADENRSILARQLRHTAANDRDFARTRLRELMAYRLVCLLRGEKGDGLEPEAWLARQGLRGIKRISPSAVDGLQEELQSLFEEVRVDLIATLCFQADEVPATLSWSLAELLGSDITLPIADPALRHVD